MPKMPLKKEHNMELYEKLSQLDSPKRCFDFLCDLCSPSELAAFEQRYEVACMLAEGYVYTEISEQTHASSATISRVSRVYLDGTGALNEAVNDGREKTREKRS